MSIMLDPAKRFFEACETGKGWEECKAYCNPDATFSSQTNALSDISTVEGYCEWTKNLLTPIPDGRYELKFFAADEANGRDTRTCAPGGIECRIDDETVRRAKQAVARARRDNIVAAIGREELERVAQPGMFRSRACRECQLGDATR